ncbi:MAG: response regulator [Deltaproteobacteria bacterium]|nr:response regulator [Deltaproteobacteria bacterium]
MQINIRLLLLCDDALSCREITQSLKDRHSFLNEVQLFQVAHFSEAFALLESNAIDVALLDLNLKGFQGLETLRLFRENFKTIPVIVLSALHDEATPKRALEEGAQDYLIKGTLDSRLLAKSMTYAIERARLLNNLENSSEERFHYMIDQSADGLIVIDEAHVVKFLNPAAELLLRHPKHKILGRQLGFPLTENQNTKLEIPLPDGEKKIAEVQVAQIEWENKKAFLLSITDVTELMRLEQMRSEVKERRRLDKLKDDFISTVSHELRTPLTIVKAAISNLKDGVVGELTEKQKRVLDITNRNVDRLARLINDLLDLSRLESGFAKMNRRRLNLLPILQEVLQSFQTVAKEKNIILEAFLPPHIPMVYADPDLLSQVLHNLMNNALRFAKEKIILRAVKLDREDLRINIEDDGPGIEKNQLANLFNKFVQVNRPVGGEGYKGTGLGLVICKEILEHHNGQIGVDSFVGMGSCFYFTLPKYEEEVDYEVALQGALKDAEERNKKVSLLVLRVSNLEEIRLVCDAEQIDGFMSEVEECLQSEVLRREDRLISHPLKAFVLVVAETALLGATSLRVRMEKELNKIKLFSQEGPVRPEFKIGIAVYPDDTQELPQLLDLAQRSSKESV